MKFDKIYTCRKRTQSLTSLTSLRQELLLNQKECHYCYKPLHRSSTEMDHKIPVAIFGELIDDKWNLTLSCKSCHIKKTIIDKKIIRILKDLQFIDNNAGLWNNNIPIEDLWRIYIDIFTIYIKYLMEND